MLITDRLLSRGLSIHQQGVPLDAALRMSTHAEVSSQAQVGGPGAVSSAHVLGRRFGPSNAMADAWFTWAFVGDALGVGKPLGALVRAGLQSGTSPADAVREAILELDRRRKRAQFYPRWCANAHALYAPLEVLPYLPRSTYATANPVVALASLARWVASKVRYVSDQQKWGVPDFWQSPALTLATGSGDCEDSALVVWSGAPLIGSEPGRLVVGEWGKVGHAWVEFPEYGLHVEATKGVVSYLINGTAPAGYRPWLYAHANGACEIVD